MKIYREKELASKIKISNDLAGKKKSTTHQHQENKVDEMGNKREALINKEI